MIDSLLQPFDWIAAFPILALLPAAALQLVSYARRCDTLLAKLTKAAWLVFFVYALVRAWAVLLDPTQVAPDIRFVDAALTIATITACFSLARQPPAEHPTFGQILFSVATHRHRLRSAPMALLAVLMIGCPLVLAYLGWQGGIGGPSFPTVLGWSIYVIVGSLVGLLVLRYLNRRRLLPIVAIGVMAAVYMVCAPAAAFFNRSSPATFVTVGFNEEFWKVYPILVMLVFLPNVVRSPKDGLTYGALGGFAFNFIEASSYIVNAARDTGIVEALRVQGVRLSYFGLDEHVLWSALVGLGLGIGATSSGWRKRYLLPIGIYLFIAISHSAFDLGLGALVTAILVAVMAIATSATPTDPASLTSSLDMAARLVNFVYNPITVVVLIIAIIRGDRAERAAIHRGLHEQPPSIVTDEELRIIERESFWRRAAYPNAGRRYTGQIKRLQNFLGFGLTTGDLHDAPNDALTALLKQGIVDRRVSQRAAHAQVLPLEHESVTR
jgi:RsiW-degrading membrane proteinase PrsW (M82 family)